MKSRRNPIVGLRLASAFQAPTPGYLFQVSASSNRYFTPEREGLGCPASEHDVAARERWRCLGWYVVLQFGPCNLKTEHHLGKKLWLKPGQRYLFGRNKADTAANERESSLYVALQNAHMYLMTDSFALNHKTVSRKHVILSVAAVVAGEGVGKGPGREYHSTCLTRLRLH